MKFTTTNQAIFKTARTPSPLASCALHEKTPEIGMTSSVWLPGFRVAIGRRQDVVSYWRRMTVRFEVLAAV
jgi:hypothetical protein